MTDNLLGTFAEELELAQTAAISAAPKAPVRTGKLAASARVSVTLTGVEVVWLAPYAGFVDDDSFDVDDIENAMLNA